MSQFEREARASIMLDQAAELLYEAERLSKADWDLPAWESEDCPPSMQADARARVAGALRRASISVRRIASERIAQTLALADGYDWPACTNKIPLTEPNRLILAAQIRQRYRRLGDLARAELQRYLELGTDTEAQRQDGLNRVAIELEHDRALVAAYRQRRVVPIRSLEFS